MIFFASVLLLFWLPLQAMDSTSKEYKALWQTKKSLIRAEYTPEAFAHKWREKLPTITMNFIIKTLQESAQDEEQNNAAIKSKKESAKQNKKTRQIDAKKIEIKKKKTIQKRQSQKKKRSLTSRNNIQAINEERRINRENLATGIRLPKICRPVPDTHHCLPKFPCGQYYRWRVNKSGQRHAVMIQISN